MLNYTEAQEPAHILADHYSKDLDNILYRNFILGNAEIQSAEHAQKIIDCFWAMTELAIADNSAGKEIAGVTDIEFWMHKIYQKVSGYMTTHGYNQLWDESHENR